MNGHGNGINTSNGYGSSHSHGTDLVPPVPKPQSAGSMSGLLCSCYRTTGERPPGLNGASTTLLGDNLYVFGGQRLGTRRLSQHLYVLDLLRKHWTRLKTTGDVPSPRYFHSMNALGDTKLVLFGGSILGQTDGQGEASSSSSYGTVPVADVFMFDIASQTWTEVTPRSRPAARYAHCATILPSSSVYSSIEAPISSLHHNVSSSDPNRGTLGVQIDGTGGAELLVVGGQHSETKYADTVDIFNFRSLKWTSTTALPLGKFGVYRSAAVSLNGMESDQIGVGRQAWGAEESKACEIDLDTAQTPALFYSNYNFKDPKSEVMLRDERGELSPIAGKGQKQPPGLRFPTAGVVDQTQ